MTRKRKTNRKTKRKAAPLQVLDGQREALERELMWLILLGGDDARKEVLVRRLTPSANDNLSVAGGSGAKCVDESGTER